MFFNLCFLQIRGKVHRIFKQNILDGGGQRLTEAWGCLISKTKNEKELKSEDIVRAVTIVESKTSKKRVTNVIKFKDVSYRISFHAFA